MFHRLYDACPDCMCILSTFSRPRSLEFSIDVLVRLDSAGVIVDMDSVCCFCFGHPQNILSDAANYHLRHSHSTGGN